MALRAQGTARSQPCCTPSTGGAFPEDVLYTYYDSQDGTDDGVSTPNADPGASSTLTADPADWTGDDMP